MINRLALFLILYLPFQIALNPFPGADMASARIVSLLVFLLWLATSLKNRKFFVPASVTTWLVLSFLFISGLSVFQAENEAWAFRKMAFFLSFFPLYFVFSSLAQNASMARKIMAFLAAGGILASLTALFQFSLQFILGLDRSLRLWEKIIPAFLGNSFSLSVLEYPSWLVNAGGRDIFRALGFFPDPHMLSLFLGLALPWAIILAYHGFKGKEPCRFFWLIGSVLILLADLLTFSRGGYLGLAGGMATGAIILSEGKRFKSWIAGFILAVIPLLIIPSPVSDRFLSTFDLREGSNQSRIENWKEAVRIISVHPWIGTGIGNYSLTIKPSTTYREPIYAHNLFLDVAAETGILNLALFVAAIILSIRSFLRLYRANELYLAGVLSLIIFSIHSIFENGLFSVQVLPLLLIVLALGNKPLYEK